jgi:XTP/dITP diphosphohydrolase
MTSGESPQPEHAVYLLLTSPRLPAGILTAQAWQLLHINPVFAQATSEITRAIESAGISVSFLDSDPVSQLLSAARKSDVVWLVDSAAEADFAKSLAVATIHEQKKPRLEVVYGSWDPPGARLLDVVAVLDRLRSPGGCPWDAEQTHQTLKPYLLEEAYEAYDAINAEDRPAMIEELGDVLLQTVFHARIAAELPDTERWTIDDVAATLVEKLVNRHPHVFGSTTVTSAQEVRSNWEEIKRAEKKRSSILDGVARAQSALSLVAKYLEKVDQSRLNISVPALPTELTVPVDAEDLGDLLFAVVAAARNIGLDAESALRNAADRYAGQVRALEENSS